MRRRAKVTLLALGTLVATASCERADMAYERESLEMLEERLVEAYSAVGDPLSNSAEEITPASSPHDFWGNFLARSFDDLSLGGAGSNATVVLGPPKIADFLGTPLVFEGVEVREYADRDADRAIGVATCRGGPIIVLGRNPDYGYAGAAHVFFRLHELGHHVLGHIDCSVGKTRRDQDPQLELDADCFAVESLMDVLPSTDAARVVEATRLTFALLDWGRSAAYPSSQERAKNLYGCIPGDVAS